MRLSSHQALFSSYRLQRLVGALLFVFALTSCAANPPVQAMSDARQAINAAREAQATRYAPDLFKKAENAMEEASQGMEQGHYLDAREAAHQARTWAIKARDAAIAAAPSENQSPEK